MDPEIQVKETSNQIHALPLSHGAPRRIVPTTYTYL